MMKSIPQYVAQAITIETGHSNICYVFCRHDPSEPTVGYCVHSSGWILILDQFRDEIQEPVVIVYNQNARACNVGHFYGRGFNYFCSLKFLLGILANNG